MPIHEVNICEVRICDYSSKMISNHDLQLSLCIKQKPAHTNLINKNKYL